MDKVKNWIKARSKERTTVDGAILIIAGLVFLVIEPLAKIVAVGAMAYGAFTIVKKG